MTTASDRLRTGLLTRWPGRAALLMLFAALLIGAVLVQNGEITLPERRQVIDPAEVRHEEGHSYILNVHILPCDGTGVSQLELYEDGTRLGPPHTLHADIRAEGEGRYSHKNERLRFAASDNSDPRDNGRTYTMVYPATVPPWVVAVLGVLILVLALPYGLILASPANWRNLGRRSRAAMRWLSSFNAQSARGRRVRAMIGAGAIVAVATFGTMLAMRMEIIPPPERSRVINPADLAAEEGHCWVMHLDVEPCDGTGTSRLVLYEDGQPLGPAHSSHADIRDEGEGRYSHKNERLRFAASDNSDPTANGREYVIEYPILPPPWLWWTVGIAAAALSAPWLWRWRDARHWPVRPMIVHSVITVLLLSMVTWNAVQEVDDESLFSDGGHYLRMGLNLYRNGTLSLSDPDAETIEPTSYREPVMPALLTMFMYALPSFDGDESYDELVDGGPALLHLKYCLIGVLVILCAVVGVLTWRMTASPAAAYGAMILAGLSETLVAYTNTTSTELFSALLIVALGWLLYEFARTPRWSWILLIAVLLGALVLTRAVFVYFFVLIPPAVGMLWWRGAFSSWRPAVFYSLGFLIVYSAIVAGWCTRNYVQVDAFTLTQRGGIVAYVRAKKDLMTYDEYIGSFYVWARPNPTRDLMSDLLGYDETDLEKGGRLERLNRSLPTSYYQQARQMRTDLRRRYADHSNPAERADEELKRKTKDIILNHPVRHILAIGPFAWRGHFVERGIQLHNVFDLRQRPWVNFSALYWIAFLAVVIYAFRRRCWAVLYVALPVVYLFGVQVLMTHNLPRYNMPLVPLLCIFTILAITVIVRYVQSSRDGKRERPSVEGPDADLAS